MKTFYIYYEEGGNPDTIKAKSWYWKSDGIIVVRFGGKQKDMELRGVLEVRE